VSESSTATGGTDEPEIRTRTYTWTDPRRLAAGLGDRSGIDRIRELRADGHHRPPLMQTLDIAGVEIVAEGRSVVTMRVAEFHYNSLGSVHGGVIAALLDSACGAAVHSTLPAGWGFTSLDLTTKFLRPVTLECGLLRCEGTVVSRGRTTALGEARLLDERDRLLAHASSTCLLFELP
jgi:uncharacterized protein (TIGR00369 family)